MEPYCREKGGVRTSIPPFSFESCYNTSVHLQKELSSERKSSRPARAGNANIPVANAY